MSTDPTRALVCLVTSFNDFYPPICLPINTFFFLVRRAGEYSLLRQRVARQRHGAAAVLRLPALVGQRDAPPARHRPAVLRMRGCFARPGSDVGAAAAAVFSLSQLLPDQYCLVHARVSSVLTNKKKKKEKRRRIKERNKRKKERKKEEKK